MWIIFQYSEAPVFVIHFHDGSSCSNCKSSKQNNAPLAHNSVSSGWPTLQKAMCWPPIWCPTQEPRVPTRCMATIHQSSSLKPAAEILLKTDAETTETTVAKMKLKNARSPGGEQLENKKQVFRHAIHQLLAPYHLKPKWPKLLQLKLLRPDVAGSLTKNTSRLAGCSCCLLQEPGRPRRQQPQIGITR